ncbi:MAG: hypothetical protein JW822_14120 [Spirochaetales bacterium]|nr:hypothetical protein [Spirochaetales bacterium]
MPVYCQGLGFAASWVRAKRKTPGFGKHGPLYAIIHVEFMKYLHHFFILLFTLASCTASDDSLDLFFNTYNDYNEYVNEEYSKYLSGNISYTYYPCFLPQDAFNIYFYNTVAGFLGRYNYSSSICIDIQLSSFFPIEDTHKFFTTLEYKKKRKMPIPDWFISVEEINNTSLKSYYFKDMIFLVNIKSKTVYYIS